MYLRIILIFLFGLIYAETYAQRKLIYPARKDALWGFINSSGQWVIKPIFIHNMIWPDTGAYYFMVSQGEQKRINNLVVLNKYGDTICFLKDSIYAKREFRSTTYLFEDFANGIKFGHRFRDSVIGKRKKDEEEWENARMVSKRDKLNIREFDVCIESYEDRKCWFRYGKQDSLADYQPLNGRLFLVQKGYNLSSRYRGDIIQSNIGLWGIMDTAGIMLVSPCVTEKSDIRFSYKNREVNDSQPDQSNSEVIECYSIIFQSGENYYLKILNRDFREIFQSQLYRNHRNNKPYYEHYDLNEFTVIKLFLQDSSRLLLQLDTNGNILDTLEDFKWNWGTYFELKKQGKWTVHNNYNRKNLFSHTGEKKFYMFNDDVIIFPKGDSIEIVDMLKNTVKKLPGHFLYSIHPGYYLTKKIIVKYHDPINSKYMYLLLDSSGRLIFKDSASFFNFIENDKVFSLKIAGKDKHMLFRESWSGLKWHPIIPGLFMLDSAYLEMDDFLKDSTFRNIPLYHINEYREDELCFAWGDGFNYLVMGDSILAVNKQHHNRPYKINGGVSLNRELKDSVWLAFRVGRYIYLHNPESQRFYRIRNNGNRVVIWNINGLLCFTNPEGDDWFYINNEGKIIYKYGKTGRLRSKPVTIKDMIRKM